MHGAQQQASEKARLSEEGKKAPEGKNNSGIVSNKVLPPLFSPEDHRGEKEKEKEHFFVLQEHRYPLYEKYFFYYQVHNEIIKKNFRIKKVETVS